VKARAIPYSAEEMAWLEVNRMMVISDYHRAFAEAFGRPDVSAAHLHGLRKRKGWKVGRAPGRLTGRHWRYSAAELAWLEERSKLPIPDLHRAFVDQFARLDVTPAKLLSLRKRMGWRTGRTGQFPKGGVSHNKGKKMPFNANTARTQFKGGQLPHNTKWLGHERVDGNGYVVISIGETNPHTGFERRYVLKHKYLWEQANGPIPTGMCLKCLGERQDSDPSNWELVPRGLLPRLNGKSGRNYDAAPAELKPTIMAIAKLEHRARERKSGKAL
jgi:hypothetical protein